MMKQASCSTALSPGHLESSLSTLPIIPGQDKQHQRYPHQAPYRMHSPMGIRITLEVGQENKELSSDFCVKSSRNMELRI